MATPHNEAKIGDFAPVVLMPGDPLRAKMIAERYLTDAVLVNQVRGMLAYTGTFKGKPVSVMASGMGMPSIGIYSYELYQFYGVEKIIRIGSAGAYIPELNLGDVILVEEAYSESTYGRSQSNDPADTLSADPELMETIWKTAEREQIPVKRGKIHCSDVFYRDDAAESFESIRDEKGCICVEMESFGLFHNARVCGKKAACLLTISDSLVTAVEMSAADRQNTFDRMITLALESAIA